MKEDGAAEAKEHCQHVRVRYCEGVGNFFFVEGRPNGPDDNSNAQNTECSPQYD